MALGSPFDKFITAAMKRAFQKIHHSRANMSFMFTYIKFQAKQF